MADLKTYLQNVLLALQEDVAPAVTTDRARTSAKAISHVLARLIVNAEAATASRLYVPLETPEAAFGGIEAHRAKVRAVSERLGPDGLVSNVLDDLRWERDLLGRAQANSMSLIAGSSGSHRPAATTLHAEAASQLQTHLRCRLGGSGRVTAFRDLFGGRSKITSLVTIGDFPGLNGQFALRRDAPANLTGGRSVLEEYPLLQVLHSHGVRVPQPMLVEADPAVLGSPFMIVERLPGSCGDIYRAPDSIALLQDVAALLAKLHSVPLSAFAATGLRLQARSRDGLAAQIDSIERAWRDGDAPTSIAMPTAFHWLRRNLDRALQGSPSLAHGDARFHNILFDGEAATGLLDWELSRAGYPAEDLGYLRPIASQVMPWEAFMAAYTAAGGRKVPQDQIDFYAILSAAYMASLSASVKKLVLEGRTRDIQLTAVPVHDIYTWIHEISEHLVRVGQYS